MDFALPPELAEFQLELRSWVDAELPKHWTRELEASEDYPQALWDKLAAKGLHAISVPKAFGGQGASNLQQMIVARELGRSLSGLLWLWGVNAFAGAYSIALYGSDEQKRRFLPDIAAGKTRFTIGFTEPDGGTDLLGGLKTAAVKVEGGWRINGRKRWCAAAHVSDYILLLALTDPTAEKRHRAVSLFAVPARSSGISLKRLPTLGMRALGAFEVTLDDVFVPDDSLLGEANRAWYMLLPTLNNERLLLLGLCCGILDGIFEDALAYVKSRTAFGSTIGSFQAVQHHLVNIAMARRQTELVAHHAAWLDITGQPAFLELTMGKVIATEHTVAAADIGIQLLGGQGYSAETDMQRYWRDARLYRMSPVTNEMARNLVAEHLGLPRSF